MGPEEFKTVEEFISRFADFKEFRMIVRMRSSNENGPHYEDHVLTLEDIGYSDGIIILGIEEV